LLLLAVLVSLVRWIAASGEASLDEQVREAHRAKDFRRAGDIQARRGKYVEAARLYANGGEWARQARALQRAGDLRAAAEAFARAEDPDQAALLFEQVGEHKKATEQKAKRATPEAQRQAAEAFAKQGEHVRAAKIFAQLGDYERAADAYGRAARLDPPDVVVTMLENAALGLAAGDRRRAALLLRAGDAAYQLGLHERAASAYDGAGDLKKAAQLYERALKRYDMAGAIWAELGDAAGVARATPAAGGEIEILRARETRARERGDLELAKKLRAKIRELAAAKRPSTMPPPEESTGEVSIPVHVTNVPAKEKPRPSAPEPDTASRYEILDELARGGMGIVYRARDRLLGRAVALKFLPEEMARDETNALFFRREARAAAALSHPGIVTIFDIGTYRGREFIAMELLEGKQLEALIREQGKLSVLDGLEMAEAAVAAVAYAHEHGIVHRDIKPANLMRLKNGAIKVMDFGLAKSTGKTTMAGGHPTIIAGTPAYMPPEQYRGITDARSDVFAMGATMYEMFTGVLPGTETETVATAASFPTVREREPLVPERLSQLIMRCMERDPARRPQSMSEVGAELSAMLAQLVDALRALEPTPPRTSQPGRRSRESAETQAAIPGVVYPSTPSRKR
jgi:tetratricopeptide (TPR) repeat protein